MHAIRFLLTVWILACASLAQADTRPIFTLKAVADYATWIATGRIKSVREAGCSAEGFGAAMIATLTVNEVWKGTVGKEVEFAYYPEKSVVHPLPGARYVIAFQRLQVPCGNVSYDEGFLPIDGLEVVTSRLVDEPQRQLLSTLKMKFKARLPSGGK
jgi:hypothetical protein